MNVTNGFQSNVTSSTAFASTGTVPTTGGGEVNDSTGYDVAMAQKDSEDNGLIAVYVIVPVLILAGVLVVLILVIKRRKQSHKNKNDHDCYGSEKASKTDDIGIDNGAFSKQNNNEKHKNLDISIGPSSYEEINDQNSIYYENEKVDTKQSENMYYDYNSQNRQFDGDMVEDEYGYGQFTKDTNCYQNVLKQSGTNNLKKTKTTPSTERNSKVEYDSEPVYVNDAGVTAMTKLDNEKKAELKQHSVKEVDPLYDHAKAGGHEWDNREKFKTEKIKNNNNNLENIYMNDSNNTGDLQDSNVNTNDDGNETDNTTRKIPVYLELEPKTDEDKEDLNSLREDDNEYDSACNHEYFILEKIKSSNNISENIYMNDSNNIGNAQDKNVNTNDECNETDNTTRKIPVYLELEPETDEDKENENLESAGARVDITDAGDMYDYDSSESIDNVIEDDSDRTIDYPKQITDDRNSFKPYANEEDVNSLREDDNEYDSASNHEYFILEKVESRRHSPTSMLESTT